MCTAAIGVGAALGFVPGYVSVALQDSLELSKAQVGLLVSLYFGSTGLASVGGGRLAARLGARTVIVADMVVVAASATVGALTERYWVLLASAVVAGAGYAWANAGTNDALARTVPPRHRTVAFSVKTAGVPTMAAATAALGAPAANRWSWTVVWLAVAVAAVVVAVAVALVLAGDRGPSRPSPEPAVPDHQKGGPQPPESVVGSEPVPEPGPARVRDSAVAAVDLRSFHWFSLASFLFVAGSQPIFSWVVPYLQDRLDTSAGVAGALASAAAGLGVVAMIANGRLADRIGPDRRIGRLLVLVVAATAGMAAILLGPVFAGGSGLLVVGAGMIIGTSVQLATIGTMHAALVDRAGLAVAQATGITMTGYYLGALLSPVGFGWLVDVTDRYWPSWLVMVVLTAASLPVWRRAGRIPVAGATAVPTPSGSP
ncbi:MAG: MFS transporter [Acidimicrobiia bacterium]|nr:MFS transporter [Acidimicrobiia bacterium]